MKLRVFRKRNVASVIPYPQFRTLTRCRAYEIYTRRVEYGTPGTELSDWLTAENELYSSHRVLITLGICSCSAGRCEKTFQMKKFTLRGVPCTFKTVIVDQNNECGERRRHGCHVFLDQHDATYADLMATEKTFEGKTCATGGLLQSRSTRRKNDIFGWFVGTLEQMVIHFTPDEFQEWLAIEPSSTT